MAASAGTPRQAATTFPPIPFRTRVFGLGSIENSLRSIDAKRRRPRSVAYYLLLILFGGLRRWLGWLGWLARLGWLAWLG